MCWYFLCGFFIPKRFISVRLRQLFNFCQQIAVFLTSKLYNLQNSKSILKSNAIFIKFYYAIFKTFHTRLKFWFLRFFKDFLRSVCPVQWKKIFLPKSQSAKDLSKFPSGGLVGSIVTKPERSKSTTWHWAHDRES